MDHPPLLKTRRSNAVHSRRLAVHVSLLERHLAVLEADRARAVRALQDELSHLRVLRRPLPPLSPAHRREAVLLGGSSVAERNSPSKTRKALPPLERLAATENKALVLIHPSQKWPPTDTQKKLIPPITAMRDSSSNGHGSVIKESAVDADAGSKLPDSSSPRSETCPRSSLAESGRSTAGGKDEAGPESEQRTAAQDRKSGSGDTSDDPVGVPPKGHTFSPRKSRPLPPLSLDNLPSQEHDHRQPASKKEREVLKGNLSGKKNSGATESSESFEGVRESKSDHSAEVKPVHHDSRPSEEPEPRSKIRMIQNEVKEFRISSKIKHSSIFEKAKDSSFSKEVDNAQLASDKRQPHGDPHLKNPSAQRTGSRSVDNMASHYRHVPGRPKCHLALARSDRCGYFPCTRPPTYHSLGFHPDLSTHPWPLWLLQNARRPHHRLKRTSARPPSQDTQGGGEVRQTADPPDLRRRSRRLGKEEVVRLDMARKKRLHALHRPPSWNTNYGRPTPYKRLNRPLRLKPLW